LGTGTSFPFGQEEPVPDPEVLEISCDDWGFAASHVYEEHPMQMNTHLSFNGDCEVAFRSYAKIFGGEVAHLLPYGEAPLDPPPAPGWEKKILHGTVTFGAVRLTGADVIAAHYARPAGFSVLVDVPTAAEAERIFAALSDGGSIQLALAETFWAARFGMLTDRFGVPWMLNCGKPA
jgi:PhnB protein